MKIGVTGSDHICDRIQKTLEKRMPDLEVVYRRSNDYRYGLEAAAQFQKGKVSGIIFTIFCPRSPLFPTSIESVFAVSENMRTL